MDILEKLKSELKSQLKIYNSASKEAALNGDALRWERTNASRGIIKEFLAIIEQLEKEQSKRS